MWPTSPDRPAATTYIDYRPSRCRCGAIVQPHEVVCARCDRRQNLLFSDLDRLHEKDLDGLLEHHRREVDANPNDHLRLYNLAGVYLLRGAYEAAANLYRRVTEMQPAFPEAHLNLGGVLAFLGDNEGAVREFKEFVRLDIHSPKVERAIRAICSIKNIPYEDAVREAGVKDIVPRPQSAVMPPPLPRSGTMYYPPPPLRRIPRRSWGVIDIFLLFIIVAAVAAWFIFPAQSRSVLSAPAGVLESRYKFSVTNEKLQEAQKTGESADQAGQTSTADQEDETASRQPEVINANPLTESYFPAAAGNRWVFLTYDTRDPSGGGSRIRQSTTEILVKRLADAQRGIWEIETGGDTVYFLEKSTGLYSVNSLSKVWSTAVLQIPYPPTVGRSLTDSGQTVTVEAVEVVSVPAGSFECVKLHYTLEEPGMEWYTWYGRDVGPVKYMSIDRTGTYEIRELTSYELH